MHIINAIGAAGLAWLFSVMWVGKLLNFDPKEWTFACLGSLIPALFAFMVFL